MRACGTVLSKRERERSGLKEVFQEVFSGLKEVLFDQFVILSMSEEKEEIAACLSKGYGMSWQRVESSANR